MVLFGDASPDLGHDLHQDSVRLDSSKSIGRRSAGSYHSLAAPVTYSGVIALRANSTKKSVFTLTGRLQRRPRAARTSR
jgi:hypothetical protein